VSGLATYALALAATLAVELALVAALGGRDRRGAAVEAAAWLNLVTHPLATLAVHLTAVGVWPLELAVTALELCGYRLALRAAWARAALLAIAANAASFALGLAWS
jgi:hypothetical protein